MSTAESAFVPEDIPSGETQPDIGVEVLSAAAVDPPMMPTSTSGRVVSEQMQPEPEPLRAVQPSLTPSVRRRSRPDSPNVSPDAAAATADELDALQLSSSCAAPSLLRTLLTHTMCAAPQLFCQHLMQSICACDAGVATNQQL